MKSSLIYALVRTIFLLMYAMVILDLRLSLIISSSCKDHCQLICTAFVKNKYIFLLDPFFTVVVFQEEFCTAYTFSISFIRAFLLHIQSFSKSEERANSLDDDIFGFTGILSSFTMRLLGLLFQRKG